MSAGIFCGCNLEIRLAVEFALVMVPIYTDVLLETGELEMLELH